MFMRRKRLFNFQDRQFLHMNLLNICKAKEKYFTAAVMENLWLRIYKPCVKLFQTVLNHWLKNQQVLSTSLVSR